MTEIVIGMTPAEFIIALNNNYGASNILIDEKASVTEITNSLIGSVLLTPMNANFTNINAYPYTPIELTTLIIGMAAGSFISTLNNSFNDLSGELDLIKEKKISDHGCWGVPSILPDPNNSGKYIIIWQWYASEPEIDSETWYTVFDPVTNTYTTPATVFDASEETMHQGHPAFEYFGGKYHIVFAQSSNDNYTDGKLVDIESVTWAAFQNYVLSNTETTITPECGLRPVFTYLKISDTITWLIYTVYSGGKMYICYTVWNSSTGWDLTEHRMTETEYTTGSIDNMLNVASAIKNGNNLFIYYGNRVTQKIMVVVSEDNGATWETPADTTVTNCGISSRGMVKKYGDNFYMVYNALDSLRIAKSTTGITFNTITVLKTCYSYFTDWQIIDETHILVVWTKRTGIGENGEIKNDLNGVIIYIGDYLTS